MKSDLQANSARKQTQDSAAATTTKVTQDHEEQNLESTTANGRDTEPRHFRRWWNEYQKKMKSAFQATPLKLQTQAEQ
ncbi:MAG: hypothetical protein ACM3SW_02455 [Actinomycetota bacterium]